ncbi:MAG: hypothetical protein KDD55_03915, partial [Bdellovibrionales bacterium]|nr:hypothetical protein [Bdellovibrionales bacterium]
KGPYAMWHHEHFIHEHKNGVVLEDRISYLMRFGALGSLAHSLLVRHQLDSIFSFRKKALTKRYETFNLDAV